MTLQLVATVLSSAEAEHAQSGVSPWWFGGAAMGAFLLMLFLVTRLDLDR